MSLQLRPDELLTVLERMDSPQFADYLDRLLALCEDMGQTIVASINNVQISHPASFWDGMVCQPITPIDANLSIPEHLKDLDDGGWE